MLKLATLTLSFLVSTFVYAEKHHEVNVVYPQITETNQVLSLSGTVEAKQNARLALLQSGVVSSLLVDAGDVVEKGQKLVLLDDKLAKINVEQARADFEASLATMQEAQRLFDEVNELSYKNVVEKTLIGERQSSLSIAKALHARAKAELTRRQEELSRHTLYAPFSGVIASRNIDVGEWVTQQTVVFTLVGHDQLRINLAVPQEYYTAFSQPNDISVTVIPDLISIQSIEAKVSRIVAVADNVSRSFTAWVDIEDNPGLVVGMSTKVALTIPSSAKEIVWLPKSVIKYHPDGGRSLFVVENGLAKNLAISVVEQKAEQVAVTGISTDNPVIVSGVAVLTVGSKVTIKQDNK